MRRRRSVHRFGLDQFTEFEASAGLREQRVAGSDLAFFNDGDLDELREFVAGAYETAKSLLRHRAERGAGMNDRVTGLSRGQAAATG